MTEANKQSISMNAVISCCNVSDLQKVKYGRPQLSVIVQQHIL